MTEEKQTPLPTRIQVEWDDGKIEEISGDRALRWWTFVNATCRMAMLHPHPNRRTFDGLKWDVIKEAD